MNIRLEIPADFREVENLTREAFWNVYRPGCTEHYVLYRYRNNPHFIPTGETCIDETLAGSDRPMRALRLETKR